MARKLFTLALLLAVAIIARAQDIITTVSDVNIEATITSIDVDVIRYRPVGQTDTEAAATQAQTAPEPVTTVSAETAEPPVHAVEHPSINAYPLPSVEELQWDYQRALSLRNTGTGLMTSGSLLTLLGIASPFLFLYDTTAFGIAVVLGWGIATPIGTGLLIAGIPCYIIGNNRMAQAAFAIRQYSVNMPLYERGDMNISLGLAPGTVGLALNF